MTLNGIPGELYERPWVNFGFNRTQALELAKSKADYLLIIDADDWLEYKESYSLPQLKNDMYQMWRGNQHFSYLTPQLVKTDLPWKWVGVLHEYLSCDCPYSSEILEEIRYIQTEEGSRSQDPQKYLKHVQLLQEGLKEEPNNSRYVFYLAESYRAAGDFKSAIKWYQKTVEMEGWEEEIYWSLVQIAKLKKELEGNHDSIIEAFNKAHRFRPHRIEAIYYLVEFYNQIQRYDLAYECIQMYVANRRVNRDILFNERWMEDWGLAFQKSICAYYLDNFQESLNICDQLLADPAIPENFKSQITKNRKFPLQKLNNFDKKILLAILARNKAHLLPFYLKCIEELDYDKKLITVYINTNNNADNTLELLQEWAAQNEKNYARIVIEHHEEPSLVDTNPHEWNIERWKLLGNLRNKSLKKTKEYQCDYYFTVDCDNFIAPCTLNELIKANKPIIAPLLRAIPEPGDIYSNFFAAVDHHGYYKETSDYHKILNREKIGIFKVPVVHHAYLIKSEMIDSLSYLDSSSDWEFIIFSRNARKRGVDQYICNEKEFGSFLHFSKNLTLEEEREAFQKIALQSPYRDCDIVDSRIRPDDKRYQTFKRALQLMDERNVKSIVETGTARGGQNNFEGDGGSTILFSDWASRHDATVHSIDIDKNALEEARIATVPFQHHIHFIQSDSVEYLRQFTEKIDFLYLDSFDFNHLDPNPSQQHHLNEISAAYDKLTSNSIIMIDDCKLPHGGKGKEVISFLIERGWKIIEDEYQVILVKAEENPSDVDLSLLLNQAQQLHNSDPEKAIKLYLKTHFAFPYHVEPLYHLSRILRDVGKYEEAYQVAILGELSLDPKPNYILEKWIYDYGMLLELSLCAHASGRFKEAIHNTEKMLKNPNLERLHPTLARNLTYYQAGIQVCDFAKQKWGDFPKLSSRASPRLHVCTVATQQCQGLAQLLESCKLHNIEPIIFGLGMQFSFGQKLKWIQDYLETIPDSDIVLFLDAYDTLILADERTILDKFYAMEVPFVISTETNCHPFPHFANFYPNSPSRFKYINSGSYIGYSGYIKKLLQELSPIPDETDDQGLLTALYLHFPYLFKLDYYGELFLTLYQVSNDQIGFKNGKVDFLEHGTHPCVIHGNGPSKELYQFIYEHLFKSNVRENSQNQDP